MSAILKHQVTEAEDPFSLIDTEYGRVRFERWLQMEITRNHAKDFRNCWVERVGHRGQIALFTDSPDFKPVEPETENP